MDLSFPGQQTVIATSCIPHDSVNVPGTHTGKSENGHFVVIIDSKICEAEVTLTTVINTICKPCICYSYRILSTDVNLWPHFMGWFGSVFS